MQYPDFLGLLITVDLYSIRIFISGKHVFFLIVFLHHRLVQDEAIIHRIYHPGIVREKYPVRHLWIAYSLHQFTISKLESSIPVHIPDKIDYFDKAITLRMMLVEYQPGCIVADPDNGELI